MDTKQRKTPTKYGLKLNKAGNRKGMNTDMKAIRALRKNYKAWSDLTADIDSESGGVVSGVAMRHRMFPHEYIRCKFDAKKAAMNIGYSPSYANEIAGQLLQRYRSKIMALVEERLHTIDVNETMLLSEMAKLATVNPSDFYDENGQLIPLPDLPRHVAAAISSFKVERILVTPGNKEKNIQPVYKDVYEYKMWDKKGANEILMKHLGMIAEKKVLTGPNDEPLIPSKVVHKFDPKSLSDEQLDALLTLAGDTDPMADVESEQPNE